MLDDVRDEPDEPEDVAPSEPDHTMGDREVEDSDFLYSTRHPKDWVLSGPLGPHGRGPGRRYPSWAWAEQFARKVHGAKVLCRVPEAAVNGGNRWAFLIRGDR